MKYRWEELTYRARNIKNPIVAEVGVWQGKMSAKLLILLPDLRLEMIDRWEPPTKEDSYYNSGSSISRRAEVEYQDAYRRCLRIAQGYKDRANIVKCDSVEAAVRYQDGFFDIVFVDGDHSYQGCHNDIVAWLQKVKPGGWMGGHDYDHPDQGEVKKAVDEIFPMVQLGANRTWWVQL